MKITVVGMGYVGLSNLFLLGKHFDVIGFDLDKKKIIDLSNGKLPIEDQCLVDAISISQPNIQFTSDPTLSYQTCDYVVVCTPTNYDEVKNSFDTSSVEAVIKDIIEVNPACYIVIKSTIPIGFVEEVRRKYQTENICFSPEFLREGSSLHDNLYPSRIIIGADDERAKKFTEMLKSCCQKSDVPILTMGAREAESVKLFSNTYLAMRVAFFNEIDNYCLTENLETQHIIRGVGFDDRIGLHYNNPSFGYGGYCLPKDTKQLLANYKNTRQALISAIIESNEIRKNTICDHIASLGFKSLGFYRLVMKKGSDNIRSSATTDILTMLANRGIEVRVFEPELVTHKMQERGVKLVDSIGELKTTCECIITNRIEEELNDYDGFIYSRDIFGYS